VFRSRWVTSLLVLVIAVAACGNSGDDSSSPTTAGDDGAAAGDGGEATRDEFVSLSGVPGVTDDEITFAVVGTKNGNPLGTCILDCYLDGIEAYFAFRNDEGGIYGRQLEVGAVLDDELAQNQVRALDVISGDDAFGVFNATLLASGWADLDAAGIPTYTWGIHANEANGRPHVFGSMAVICADCTGRVSVMLAATTAMRM